MWLNIKLHIPREKTVVKSLMGSGKTALVMQTKMTHADQVK